MVPTEASSGKSAHNNNSGGPSAAASSVFQPPKFTCLQGCHPSGGGMAAKPRVLSSRRWYRVNEVPAFFQIQFSFSTQSMRLSVEMCGLHNVYM